MSDISASASLWRDSRPVYDRGGTVCVVGAGASGLAAIKNLREHGFGVDCYERETGVGGAWNWRHDRSPVYASAHLVSSRPLTQFPDFPMPDSWPDYPHHSQVHAYLERYADHFDLRPHIWFGTEITRVEPVEPAEPAGQAGQAGQVKAAPGTRWDVTTRGARGGAERTQRYAAVVVANGHNWSPRVPEYEGQDQFRGEVAHASTYSDPTQLRNRKVLVVGAGNTGADLAVEAAQQANTCWHSTRRGYWYIPEYLLGRPADQVHDLAMGLRLPLWLRRWLFRRLLRLTSGDLTRFGLPAPDHKVFESHPVVNSQLAYYLGHGRITPVPDIVRFTRTSVELSDGSSVEPDLVLLATGYQPQFEFLAPDVLNPDSTGRPRLHLHTFVRDYPTLAVAGLLQPDSGLFTLVHWQTVALARWLRLRDVDPQRAATFWKAVAASPDRRWTRAKVRDTHRHWFEVAHTEYLRALQRTLDDLEVTV